MFKLFTTIARGRAYEAAEATLDRNALPLLRQQVRDCAHAIEASRRAVAVAMAQNEREISQHAQLVSQIKDLETRAIAALEAEKPKLAQEAAEAIAHLEAERDVSDQAQSKFRTEITRLRTVLRDSETRLRQLQRGQRLAVATDKTQRMQSTFPASGMSTLRDAEATLDRLQDRQSEMDATAQAMAELEATGSTEALRDRMAKAGLGKPITTSADDVLERLKKKSKT